MEIKIEKGIAIDNSKKELKSTISNAMRNMEIGDSFLVPKDKFSGIHMRAICIGIKITTRTVDSENKRVWRIA